MSTLVFKCVFLTHEHRSVGRVTVSFSDICSIPSTALKAWSWPYVFNSIPWVHYTHTNTHCVAVIANINKAICSNLLNSQWNLNRFGLCHFWLPQWLNQIVDYYCCYYYQRKKNSKRASTQEVINMDVVISFTDFERQQAEKRLRTQSGRVLSFYCTNKNKGCCWFNIRQRGKCIIGLSRQPEPGMSTSNQNFPPVFLESLTVSISLLVECVKCIKLESYFHGIIKIETSSELEWYNKSPSECFTQCAGRRRQFTGSTSTDFTETRSDVFAKM